MSSNNYYWRLYLHVIFVTYIQFLSLLFFRDFFQHRESPCMNFEYILSGLKFKLILFSAFQEL